jgi:hypothetical protein
LGNSKKLRMRAPVGLAVLLAGFGVMNASADTLYNNIPLAVLAANPVGGPNGTSAAQDFSYSVPYDANGVSEFGNLIQLSTSPSGAYVTGGLIALSDWGTATEAGLPANTASFVTPITITFYDAVGPPSDPSNPYFGVPLGPGGSYDDVYTVGSVIATETVDATIDFRPASAPGAGEFVCTNGNYSYSNNGNQQCGAVNLVGFTLNQTLPSTFIYGVSFATGAGQAADNSLNFGLNPFGPTVGDNPAPDTAYSTGGAVGTMVGGPGWLVDSQGNNDGQGAIALVGTTATPEPETFGLIGFGFVALGFISRRKKNRKA